MSRYVDLDGLTWDGNTINSKIQEVQTKHGYMSAITIGWLWDDNVPHIDLAEHDAKIKAEIIDEIIKIVKDHNNTRTVSTKKALDGEHQYYRAISQSKMVRLLEQLKEKNNGTRQ